MTILEEFLLLLCFPRHATVLVTQNRGPAAAGMIICHLSELALHRVNVQVFSVLLLFILSFEVFLFSCKSNDTRLTNCGISEVDYKYNEPTVCPNSHTHQDSFIKKN